MRPLKIARLQSRSRVLGPGTRAVVWTLGCSKNCPRCIAREMNVSTRWLEFSPDALFAWVQKIDGIDGVTITGGEPFEQDVDSLTAFCRLVKADSRDLSVFCYTGKFLSELRRDPQAVRALETIDVLIDGAYDYRLNDGRQWRGSSNQKIYALNERFQDVVSTAEERFDRGIEINVTSDFQVELTGIPKDGFWESFVQKLRKNGYEIKPDDERSSLDARKQIERFDDAF